jgi:hypothetical protein
MTSKTYRKITPTTFEEVDPFEQAKEEILDAPEFPKSRIKRILTLVGLAHLTLLVILFTTIVTVRYAFQL